MLTRTIESIRAFLQANLRYCGPPNTADWQSLLSWHPMCGSVPLVRVRCSRLNGSVQLQVCTGRRFYTVSWHACVHEPAVPTLAGAMREAVHRQSLDWKRLQPASATCAQCGSLSRLQVDHQTVPFKAIMTEFVQMRAPPEPSTWSYNRRSHAPRLPDGTFKRQWRLFHKSRAVFQFLCQPCNARKGARLENPDVV
jgi:hypothetical protein